MTKRVRPKLNALRIAAEHRAEMAHLVREYRKALDRYHNAVYHLSGITEGRNRATFDDAYRQCERARTHTEEARKRLRLFRIRKGLIMHNSVQY